MPSTLPPAADLAGSEHSAQEDAGERPGAALTESLREELLAERARLESLNEQKATSAERVRLLSARLSMIGNTGSAKALSAPHGELSNRRKLAVFRELFRGREDVYPTRWENKKTGKAGYIPECNNKWVDGLCNLKKVKCGQCANQAFKPVDELALTLHLRGRYVMGIYPLLADDTCWLLAMDFDGSSWRNDVLAVRETCERLNLPGYVERSRSGDGAHVWFFFTEPIPASDARKLGSHVLTETMSRRPELSFRSYDRLFPSQDTLPQGGFGNLIALPLQPAARAQGHSIFLDEQLDPYPPEEQWKLLANVKRIQPETVKSIVASAAKTGTILGVRSGEVDDEGESRAPWSRPPSRKQSRLRLTDLAPTEVRATLAQRLYVPREGLPPALLNRIKRLAAFQNPEFYKKQSMRMSTAQTPRIICCAEDLPEHLVLPRGCLSDLETLATECGIRLLVDDKRVDGAVVGFTFRGQLTALQTKASDALLAHDTGIFVGPPGVGKTVVGTALVARRGRSTLVLVHRRPLLEQWRSQLALFLGIELKDVGQIGGGRHRPNGCLDVAMVQALVHRDKVDDLVAQYGHVVVDECHHIPAVSFERVLAEVRARFIVGLTATPTRRDGHHPIAEMQLGPVRFEVNAKSQAAARPFRHKLIVRPTAFSMRPEESEATIAELYAALARDEDRNRLILDDVIATINEGRSPLVLAERKEQVALLAESLRPYARHLFVLTGGLPDSQQRQIGARLGELGSHEQRVVIATGRFIGEGFDDARLDTLFLASPVSWKGVLVQYAGRLHRLHPHKSEVRIFDYVDELVPKLRRMFDKRLAGYRSIGYEEGELPLGFDLLADPEYAFNEGLEPFDDEFLTDVEAEQ